MRHEGAGLFHPFGHEGVDIPHLAIFAGASQMADRILKGRAGGHQPVRQVEHGLKRGVADREPKVAVIDGQRLSDQV